MNASSGGATVNLTAKVTGFATDYIFSSSYGWYTDEFPVPSFTTGNSGPALTGGRDATAPGAPSLASPMITTYSYDALDNLLAVSQAGMGQVGGQTVNGQPRSYAYDGLSRLTSATTPESGTVATYYTTSGGANCSSDASAVCRRTDARNITSTYGYDGLNRLLSVRTGGPSLWLGRGGPDVGREGAPRSRPGFGR